MKGRKPKPTQQKLLAGNPGKRPLNKAEPAYDELTQADPPPWLDNLAREAWDWYAPQLISQKILTRADLHNLAAFCAAYSRWRKGEDEVICSGITVVDDKGVIKKNPAVTVINEAMKQLVVFGSLLGLDPVSRTRISAPKGSNGNPFANL